MDIKLQQNENECGLEIIKALHKHFFKHKLQTADVKKRTFLDKNGISIFDLVTLGHDFGVTLETYEADYQDVIKQQNKYFIILNKNSPYNHYFIVMFKYDYVLVFDPAKGKSKMLYGDFKKMYSNIIISVKKDPKYFVKAKSVSFIKIFFTNIELLVWIVITLLMSIIFTFTSGLFMKIIFDYIIASQQQKLLLAVFLIFVIVAFTKALNLFLKQLLIKKINLFIEQEIFINFNFKLTTLKYNQLSKYTDADILRKQILVSTISNFVGSALFLVFGDITFILVSSTILLWISVKLFAILFATTCLAIVFSIIFQKWLLSFNKEMMNKNLLLLNKQQDHIKSIFSSKSQNENYFTYSQLKRVYYETKLLEYKVFKISLCDFLVNTLISSALPLLVTYLAIQQLFSNNLTVGNMIFFLSIQSFFIGSITDLANFIIKIPENLIYINNVKEILKEKDEVINEQGMSKWDKKPIRLINLTFAYNQEVFRISDYQIKHHLQIYGQNGSGKSTLLKVLSTSLKAQGQIMLGDLKLDYFNLSSVRNQIFYLSTDSPIYCESVLNNIIFNDENYKQEFYKNIEYFKLAPLVSEINLNKQIIDNGKNISSGQKQMILLLRLLTKKYHLVLLDETMENISAANIKLLKKAIVTFQKQAIFIEVSNSKKFLHNNKEVDFATINEIK